jgi:hypothetical protein
MKGDFEKNIKNKLSDFNIEPSAQVWLDVEDALLQRRKRRIATWWWVTLPALLFLIGGGIWWMSNNNKETIPSSKTTFSLHQKNINPGVPKLKIDSSIAENTGSPSLTKVKHIKSNKENIAVISKETMANNQQLSGHQLYNEDHQVNGNKRVNAMGGVPVAPNIKENSSDSLISVVPSVKDKTTNLAEVKTDNITSSSSDDKNASSSNKSVLVAGKQKDSLFPNSIAAIKNDFKQKNRHQWLITAVGGFITVKEGASFFASNQNAYSPAPPSTGVSSGGSSGSSSIPQPGNGYSFGAGVQYSQHIHRKWEASAGVQYHYLQNRQNVGLDSVVTNSAITYFSSIQSIRSKTNYAHWIQLPVSLDYTFNPSFRYQLQLSVGGSVAWAFSEQWLVTDKTNTYYSFQYNSSLNNRFIANVHIGIGLNCNDRFRVFLLDEQSITPIHKNTTQKFYWQQFSLQISKPLHFSSHQNKPPKT